MFSPEAMLRARIVVLARQMEAVAKALGRLGVIHLRSSLEDAGAELHPEDLGDQIERCRSLRERLERLTDLVGQVPEERSAGSAGLSLDQIESLMSLLESQASAWAKELAAQEQALADAEEILRELAPYREVKSPLSGLAESALLDLKVGAVSRSRLGEMREAMPDGVLLIPLSEEWEGASDSAEMMVVSSRRSRHAARTVLNEHAFEEKKVPAYREKTPAAVYAEAEQRRNGLQARAVELRGMLREFGRSHATELTEAARSLEVQRRLLEAEQNFGATWAAAVVSGWVPAAQADALRRTVMEVTGGQAVVEVREPNRDEIEQGRVPSHVSHSAFLAPFQRLVHGYGVACYREIEPTVLFAVTFLLMFGIIFGDLGHGLCLLAIGLLTRRFAKGAAVRDVGFVIAAAGATSMLFGTFFQGSLFGKSLRDIGFPLTLGFEPIRFEGEGAGAAEHVVRYLVLAIVLGMVLISLGAVLNVVNRLRNRDYEGGLLSRFGLVGILFYWGALALGIKLIVAGAGAADVWIAVLAIVLPLVTLVFHEPIYALLTHRKALWREGPLMGLFEGLIEAMEAAMAYLANTFSFLRVAAFALSHAALCFTIFVLQRLVNDLPGGPVWSAAVFVLGTAVVIGLEGLIVTIQILRLEYYEFFTKFFRGEGVRYEPFRLE